MKYRPRIYYSEAQKATMWERWRRRESRHDIAQLFERGHSSVQRILSEAGGIRPRQRVRSRVACRCRNPLAQMCSPDVSRDPPTRLRRQSGPREQTRRT